MTTDVTRRGFLSGSLVAGGGLLLALASGRTLRAASVGPNAALDFAPHAFLRIGTDGTITLLAKHDEMGQGIHTGLAIVLCEELEVDVSDVDVVCAPADRAFAHATFGVQVTGGSTSTWTSFDQMRRVGATARTMLVAAAARRWRTDAASLTARDGRVHRADGASMSYGELAEFAGRLEVPADVALKDPATFTRIGRPTPRIDSPSKVRGTALFSLDQRRDGMLVAMVERSPFFGGRLRRVDTRAAERVPGVRAVVEVPSGVAVVADGFWAARKGREALECTWDEGDSGVLDSDALRADYVARSGRPGLVARSDGDVERAMAAAEQRIESVYEVPFQAHAPMEPLSCMVSLRDDGGADIVTGSQMLGGDHPAVAGRLGVDPSLVSFTNSYLGGGFGRRANPASDFTLEALEVALAARDLGAPIKTVWTREDDLRGGWYRPLFVNRIEVGLAGGRIVAWRHRIVGQSIAAGTAFEPMMVVEGVDGTSVEGAADMPHGIPNLQVELHTTTLPVPVQWWRSVGHSNTAFAKEAMIDECAEALGRDAYELRRELLDGHPRLQRVLDVAAGKANWGAPLPPGVGRGISVHESFQGFAAHVVEASIEDGRPKVHRVVCAIDCGLVVNPDQVVSQMEGATNFALSSALTHGITFRDGRVEQSNFHDFPLVRMHQAPRVEVHVVRSEDPMGGIGEVGVPPVASAAIAALRDAGGPRIRRLPVAGQLG